MSTSSYMHFYHGHLGEFAAVAMAFCATLSVLAWTSTGRRIGVIAVGCLRLAAASILLAIWGVLTRGTWLPTDIDSHTWIVLAVSGVLGYFLSDLFAIKAFMVVGPRLTLLLQSLSPPLVAAIGYYRFGEKIEAINLLGIAVTLGGIIWVVLEQPASRKETHRRKDFVLGVAMAVGSALVGVVGTMYATEGVRNTDPMAATQVRILAALLCYPALLTYMRRWPQIASGIRHARAMTILLLGTIVGPFLGMGLYMFALKVAPMGIVYTISCITPVLILPFSVLVYKEKVSPRAALGAIASVAGVVLLMYKPGATDVERAIAAPAAAATASAGFDDANASPLEEGEGLAIGVGIGDQCGPVGQAAESPGRRLVKLRAVGNDKHSTGGGSHFREQSRQLR
jgi:drug/metabolite transporter (DMT)-like permease